MADKKQDRRGLGRGLTALMADVAPIRPEGQGAEARPRSREQRLPIGALSPNPDQPRRSFDQEALNELAASIRAKGVIQPLIVRPKPSRPNEYEIVAGERRWRAAQIARIHEVPVLIRDLSDLEVLEIAIIENIQRSDLNPIDEAMSYRQLTERFGHTQEKLAEALSKSRSHIANLLRLLNLPDEVQAHVREGRLSAGHARALITSPDPSGLARQVIARGLSVRDTEKLAKRALSPKAPSRPKAPGKDADTRVLEQDLSANLKMQVVIDHRGHDGGQVIITYKTLEQLDQLCQVLSTSR